MVKTKKQQKMNAQSEILQLVMIFKQVTNN